MKDLGVSCCSLRPTVKPGAAKTKTKWSHLLIPIVLASLRLQPEVKHQALSTVGHMWLSYMSPRFILMTGMGGNPIR